VEILIARGIEKTIENPPASNYDVVVSMINYDALVKSDLIPPPSRGRQGGGGGRML
jgi:hypothetical protein